MTTDQLLRRMRISYEDSANRTRSVVTKCEGASTESALLAALVGPGRELVRALEAFVEAIKLAETKS